MCRAQLPAEEQNKQNTVMSARMARHRFFLGVSKIGRISVLRFFTFFHYAWYDVTTDLLARNLPLIPSISTANISIIKLIERRPSR